ncbi:MAG TPA: hypothetical protein VMU32_11615 [Solirubrobacteraceae bacterium]|nr:hypothetical protein [Solirubrobacteraceae bacterium]
MKSRAIALGALLAGCLCTGCGSSGGTGPSATITETAAKAPLSTPCATASLHALEAVGRHVYEEAGGGRIAQQAAYRLRTSAALAQAVAAGDAASVRRVLQSLLLNQIVAAQVTREGRILARVSLAPGAEGIAPVGGTLQIGGRQVGGFTLSVQGANGYAQTVSGLTATQLILRGRSGVLHSTISPAPKLHPGQREASDGGVAYRVDTFAGETLSRTPLRISLLVPESSIAAICARAAAGPAGLAQVRADTWGLVAERVYDAEHAGSKAAKLRRYAEDSRAFREAVLAGDRKATRRAIVGFFASHLHIVRVRVIREGKLLIDLGGPHVLAPIQGVIRNGRGRVVARFLMGIQDDLGFTILARAFTGAQTVMRENGTEVQGTLKPGPPSIPVRGPVSYGGHSYAAYSFYGEAFPSGPLRISLLYPAG